MNWRHTGMMHTSGGNEGAAYGDATAAGDKDNTARGNDNTTGGDGISGVGDHRTQAENKVAMYGEPITSPETLKYQRAGIEWYKEERGDLFFRRISSSIPSRL